MGTRNLICVFHNGQFILAQYGSYDGYPEGQGVAVVKFLRRPGNIQRLKMGFQHTYQVSDSEAITAKDQIDNLRGLESVAWQAYLEFRGWRLTREMMRYLTPSLHGSTGAGILDMIAEASEENTVPIKLDLEFATGWLCEWIYVIDLDGEVLEVFNGHAQHKTRDHRFKDVGGGDFVPALIFSFPFSELKGMKSGDKFLERLNGALRERDDAVRTTRHTTAEGH